MVYMGARFFLRCGKLSHITFWSFHPLQARGSRVVIRTGMADAGQKVG